MREINPSYINNLLQILLLSIKLQKFEEIDDSVKSKEEEESKNHCEKSNKLGCYYKKGMS
jgi:hypothetical protein